MENAGDPLGPRGLRADPMSATPARVTSPRRQGRVNLSRVARGLTAQLTDGAATGAGSGRQLLLAQQVLHQLRAARRVARVAVVEEQIGATRLLRELRDLRHPLAQLLLAVGVVVATLTAVPPHLGIATVEAHVGVLGRDQRDRWKQVLKPR